MDSPHTHVCSGFLTSVLHTTICQSRHDGHSTYPCVFSLSHTSTSYNNVLVTSWWTFHIPMSVLTFSHQYFIQQFVSHITMDTPHTHVCSDFVHTSTSYNNFVSHITVDTPHTHACSDFLTPVLHTTMCQSHHDGQSTTHVCSGFLTPVICQSRHGGHSTYPCAFWLSHTSTSYNNFSKPLAAFRHII